MVKMTKSKTFQAYLPNCHRTYSCIHCRAHLANHDELISKSFQGSQGRAYLFNSVVNVGCGPAEERVLLTGLHAVADIYCENCKTTLGWKYVVLRFPASCSILLSFEHYDCSSLQLRGENK
ncbi:protein yippee-like 1 isoform X1 [Stegostoma tigrinum]|uniref:protein yippee-like 1 isoform X1 n=1 Tax=Stegostoma tigrinum TaxID=3053191 RepID=UPI00202B145A|nr:protein yippee-like 1 isoform X1 [Stegostoma tigrinum]